jgi:DNA-directed RNA polymerase subunit RPC12/RpoP
MPLSIYGPHGYFCEMSPDQDKPVNEHDTYNCLHCGQQVHQLTRDQPQAMCRRCGQRVCERCAPRGACNPSTNPNIYELFEALERAEARRSYGI